MISNYWRRPFFIEKTLLILFAFFPAYSAFSETFICPDSLQTQQSIEGKTPDKWEAMDDKTNGYQRLDYVTIFDGPPSELASLVPDNEYSSNNPFWTFEKESPRRIWMSCSYTQTKVRLIRQLPKNVTKCTLQMKLKPQKEMGALNCVTAH